MNHSMPLDVMKHESFSKTGQSEIVLRQSFCILRNKFIYMPFVHLNEHIMTQKYKHKVLKQAKVIKNILAFYSLATTPELLDGLAWYKDANAYAKELAQRFNLSVSQIAGIIAAFSPQANWLDNKRFTVTFLLTPNTLIRNYTQDTKARAILTLNNESAIYEALSIAGKAFKTKAFFKNILNPTVNTGVTIDRHAIAACIQKTDNVESLDDSYAKVTKAQYDFFQSCYVAAANELQIFPHELQAIVWTVYRRLRELKAHTTEKEFEGFKGIDIESF